MAPKRQRTNPSTWTDKDLAWHTKISLERVLDSELIVSISDAGVLKQAVRILDRASSSSLPYVSPAPPSVVPDMDLWTALGGGQ